MYQPDNCNSKMWEWGFSMVVFVYSRIFKLALQRAAVDASKAVHIGDNYVSTYASFPVRFESGNEVTYVDVQYSRYIHNG